MHVGMATIFQNPHDARPDGEVYAADAHLADLAEPLGFDSVWGVEHHFTDYTMCPDVLQWLTWVAGRTTRIQVGSMVVVLPWHDPVRVAEQIAMLDHLSRGRFVLGIGRGLGRVEFEGFRVPMEESRDRFIESATMLLEGLETGVVAADGRYVQQPRARIRPQPAVTFRGRTYAAAVSPESMPIVARLGCGLLIIPQKPWEVVEAELVEYKRVYREVNGTEAPPPLVAGWTFCDPDPARARAGAERWIGGYWETVVRHYELDGDHLARTRGYESYGRMSEIAREKGGIDALTEFFLGLQIWGTPAECRARIDDIHRRVENAGFIAVFSYAGMPADEAERNMRCFATEVMPGLRDVAGVRGALGPAAAVA
jgi:alkanesulfonate monooxygenase SsuD/methylene tetrahydromethanopterin reductase-like flavin-dependent oxidoreductase (luciferase family)